MAATPTFDLDHLAHLARLGLSAAEKEKFAAQLGEVLGHMERLAQVNVSGVEPTAHAVPIANVWAADVAAAPLPVAAALANAPAQRDHLFVVPKVVE